MERYKNRRLDEWDREAYSPDERYNLAYKRVKRIKGFYVHLLVYAGVNAFLILSGVKGSVMDHAEFWQWETFSTALFWGIGLTAHGLAVFGRNIFFGPDWEERKIKELMEKEKSEKWE